MLRFYADYEQLQEHLVLVENEIRMTKELNISLTTLYFQTEVPETKGKICRINNEVQNMLEGMNKVRNTLVRLGEDLLEQKNQALRQIHEAEAEAVI